MFNTAEMKAMHWLITQTFEQYATIGEDGYWHLPEIGRVPNALATSYNHLNKEKHHNEA